MTDRDRPSPGLGSPDNPFDTLNGYSGQEFHRDRQDAWAQRHPSGTVDPRGPSNDGSGDRERDNSPPEAGSRAHFDPVSGAVHGSGASDGGGGLVEDYDGDPQGGGGEPATGAANRKERVSGGSTMRADGTNADASIGTDHPDGPTFPRDGSQRQAAETGLHPAPVGSLHHNAADARGAEIILRSPSRRFIFIGGLVAALLLAWLLFTPSH